MIWDAGRLLLVDACVDATEAEASREDIGGVLMEPTDGTGVLAIFKAETLESLISISSSSSLPKLVLLFFGEEALLCCDHLPSGSIVTCSTDRDVFDRMFCTYLLHY